MKEAVVLRCPICNSVQALEGQRSSYSKDELYSTAKNHLHDHDLNEPKTAIRKYGIVSDAVEVLISSENYDQLPLGEWKGHETTWLPENA